MRKYKECGTPYNEIIKNLELNAKDILLLCEDGMIYCFIRRLLSTDGQRDIRSMFSLNTPVKKENNSGVQCIVSDLFHHSISLHAEKQVPVSCRFVTGRTTEYFFVSAKRSFLSTLPNCVFTV